jgi:hypothetical protein
VELPEADIEEAGELTPAADAEPAWEGDRSASTGEDRAGEAQEQPAPAAKEENDAAPAADAAAAVPVAAGAVQGDGMPPDRPKKPVLAAVAIGGAVVLAVPLLLIGTGSHHAKKHRTAAAADRVLPGDGQLPPGAYTSTSPSATPTPSPSAKHTPKATKRATPKPSASHSSRAHRASGVPAGEKPMSGGNPWALELHAPYDLNPGKTLRTNRIALTMQKGGNLVLRDTSSKIIWSSGTHRTGAYAEFQSDGNLVVYVNGRQAVWASGTFGHDGATLVLQADDNMVIFDGHNAIWATGTNR